MRFRVSEGRRILLRERHKNDVYNRVLPHSQEDNARAMLDRITHIASGLESAKVKAKSLFETLNMPQNPDGLLIVTRLIKCPLCKVDVPEDKIDLPNRCPHPQCPLKRESNSAVGLFPMWPCADFPHAIFFLGREVRSRELHTIFAKGPGRPCRDLGSSR